MITENATIGAYLATLDTVGVSQNGSAASEIVESEVSGSDMCIQLVIVNGTLGSRQTVQQH